MANTFIRQAGPYLVETNGTSVLVNGVVAPLLPPARGAKTRDGDAIMYLADTGEIGANGGRNLVAITDADWAIHFAAGAASRAAAQGSNATQTKRARSERAFDAANNEGGEGYNPHRYGAARTYR